MNYYLVLGVPVTADAAAIRRAFRGLVRRYHPDAGAGSSAHKFRQIVEAYETLSNPERRRRYDASLRPPTVPRIVEPLASDGPEPLLSRRPHFSRVVDIRTREEFLLEHLFQSLERLFRDL
jgi:curved DNA-binding protein CbpA